MIDINSLDAEINRLRELIDRLDQRPTEKIADAIETLFPYLNLGQQIRMIKLYESYLGYKLERNNGDFQ